ncbi:MAG TPA: glycosyltransferase family 61 protein [Puia sp.]|nr:glycosyltransferase family 61 protein [Puia sp.]
MTTTAKIVHVRPPLNLSTEDSHLFTPHLNYRRPALKVRQCKNIFITNSGFCLDSNGLIKESHHHYPEQHQGYLDEATHFCRQAVEDPDKLVELPDTTTYLAIHHPWFNYFHWITEAILRIWLVRPMLDDLTLLLPERYQRSDFIMGSLQPFHLKNVYFLPEGKGAFVPRLCLPQIKPVVDCYYPRHLAGIRQLYLRFVGQKYGANFGKGPAIYISREKASRKKIVNESSLIHLLTDLGFTILCNEDFTFLEQVAVYSQAEFVVSNHGAGLTNMLFMKEGSSVLELHKRVTNGHDWHSYAFWYLADSLRFGYYHQICEPSDPTANYFQADINVDLDKLEQNVRSMMAGNNKTST